MSFTKRHTFFVQFNDHRNARRNKNDIHDECRTYFSRIIVHEPRAKKNKRPKTNRCRIANDSPPLCCVVTQVQFIQNTHANKLVRAQRVYTRRTQAHTRTMRRARTYDRCLLILFFPLSSSSLLSLPEFADVETSLFVAPQHHTNQYRASIGHAEMSPICVTGRCVCSFVFQR